MLLVLAACDPTPKNRLVTTFTETMDATSISMLSLTTDDGPVEVQGAATDQITVTFELLATRRNSSDDDRAADALHLELRETDAGEARGSAWLDDADGYRVGMVATVPDDLAIDIDAERGDVVTAVTGPVTVRNDAGEISIDDALDWVVVDDGDGDLVIQNVDGDVDIRDKDGDIVVRHVTGNVTVWDDEGDVIVQDVGGVRVLDDGGGDVIVE